MVVDSGSGLAWEAPELNWTELWQPYGQQNQSVHKLEVGLDEDLISSQWEYQKQGVDG